jgi:hypothetical protein
MAERSIIPQRDPDRPQDDPWDADAVRYLLAAGGGAQGWTRGVLMECLRRQTGQVRDNPRRVVGCGTGFGRW